MDTIKQYTLKNSSGMEVNLINVGASITSIKLQDKNGDITDVALGYENLEDYFNNPPYLGAVIGRNINRVYPATVNAEGIDYPLEKNEGENSLHSGSGSTLHRVFKATESSNTSVLFTTEIPHLADGFPGNIVIKVLYTLTDDNMIELSYDAIADKDTYINISSHAYFNLSGHNFGSISDHMFKINSPLYMPCSITGIPTGEISATQNTPFDFQSEKKLGESLVSEHPQMILHGGIDHNFILPGTGYREVVNCSSPKTGINMKVYTDLPGVQFYTGIHLGNQPAGKGGARYEPYSGFCLETQYAPNTPNMEWLASTYVKKNTLWSSKTGYQFSVTD